MTPDPTQTALPQYVLGTRSPQPIARKVTKYNNPMKIPDNFRTNFPNNKLKKSYQLLTTQNSKGYHAFDHENFLINEVV